MEQENIFFVLPLYCFIAERNMLPDITSEINFGMSSVLGHIRWKFVRDIRMVTKAHTEP